MFLQIGGGVGGILLGTGGLARAYAQAAKLALEEAGIARVQLWEQLLVSCSYGLYERVRRELEAAGGTIANTEFGAEVTLEALLEKGRSEALGLRLAEISAGSVEALLLGEEYRAVRAENLEERKDG